MNTITLEDIYLLTTIRCIIAVITDVSPVIPEGWYEVIDVDAIVVPDESSGSVL